MNKTPRRHFSAQDKIKILRLHLLEGKAVSALCEEHAIQPSMFYNWQKQFFENGARAFEDPSDHSQSQLHKQITHLEQRLVRKHEVLSELMEEHIRLKKILGKVEHDLGRPRYSVLVQRETPLGHIDFSYINVGGTFYYLCSVLDGCSRYVVHWELRETMKEADAELALQRARELFAQARPRVISDDGPQFVAKDFKEFLRQWQTTHVFTSLRYPQSNGKLERYHRTLKEQAIRPKTPLTLEDARNVVREFVEYYNHVRLHSALGYVTPKDRLEGRHLEIYNVRDQKLEAARRLRQSKRAQVKQKRALLKSNPPRDNCEEATKQKPLQEVRFSDILFLSLLCLENFGPKAHGLSVQSIISPWQMSFSLYRQAAFHAEPVHNLPAFRARSNYQCAADGASSLWGEGELPGNCPRDLRACEGC
jgi:transposase InsO family protein